MRVLLGDDHSLMLKGIQGLLVDHCEVVGSAANGKALVEAALLLKPDLVVLDIGMPVLNGIEAAREIKTALPSTKLIFLTMQSNPIYLRKAFEAGASGYVLKSGAAEELLTGIQEVGKGNLYITPGMGQEAIDIVRGRPERGSRATADLTGRQKQILQLLAEGKQNKEIAWAMHISVRTVEFHRKRLMTKLGTRSIAELTRFAMLEGLIDDVRG